MRHLCTTNKLVGIKETKESLDTRPRLPTKEPPCILPGDILLRYVQYSIAKESPLVLSEAYGGRPVKVQQSLALKERKTNCRLLVFLMLVLV